MIDQHASLSEKFLKKGFWLYLFSFIIAPMGYMIKIIISWELTVEEVGVLYGIISLITLLSAYNDLWMSESINHFVPKFVTEKRYDKVKTILFYAFLAQMTSWILIAIGMFLWADFLAENYFKSSTATNTLKIFTLYFLWINIFQILWVFFSSIQNTFALKVIGFIRMSFVLLWTIYIYIMDIWSIITFSYAWIGWLYIAVVFSILIFYTKYFWRYFKNVSIIWEKELFMSIFKYWLLVFLWAQAWVILGQIDMQMIIYILGVTQAWYYTNYLSIVSIPFMIIGPIFALLFPMFSEMHSTWQTQKIRLVKEVFTNNFILIGLAVNMLLFTFAIPISYVLFWEKFITSWVILQYSVLFLSFNYLFQVNFNILAWIWRVWVRAKIMGIALIINIVTNIIFIHLIWVVWAALATWIWWLLIWLMSEYIILWEFPIIIKWKAILKNILILWSLSSLLFFTYSNFINFDTYFSRPKWFIVIAWVSCIYVCIFILINYNMLRGFTREIKKLKKH